LRAVRLNAEEIAPEPPLISQPVTQPGDAESSARSRARLGTTEGAPEPQRPVIPRDPEPPLPDNSRFFTPLPELADPSYRTPADPPLGYAGPSGILPRDAQEDAHFVPVEDRWRIGFPEWDRYGKGHPWGDDYPYVLGRWIDPFNQNVLKGDFPIL